MIVKTDLSSGLYCSINHVYTNTDYSIYTGSNLNVDLL